MEQFAAILLSVINHTLGRRCRFVGYQCSEIIRSLTCFYVSFAKFKQKFFLIHLYTNKRNYMTYIFVGRV